MQIIKTYFLISPKGKIERGALTEWTAWYPYDSEETYSNRKAIVGWKKEGYKVVESYSMIPVPEVKK